MRVSNALHSTEEIRRADGTTARTRDGAGNVFVFDLSGLKTDLFDSVGRHARVVVAVDGGYSTSWDDGTVDLFAASGRLLSTTAVDGTLTLYVTEPEAITQITMPNGLICSKYENGVQVWNLPEGQRLTVDTGGSVVLTTSSGLDRAGRVKADGSIEVAIGDDRLLQLSVDGVLRTTTGDAALTLQTLARNGDRTVLDPVTQLTTIFLADGRATLRDASGNVLWQRAADGSSERHNPDGSVASVDKHGFLTSVRLGDGSTASPAVAGGSWSATDVSGVLHEYSADDGTLRQITGVGGISTWYEADGSYTRETEVGGVQTFRPDGTLAESLLSNGTRYRYDTSGELVDRTATDGTVTRYRYGRVWQVEHADGTVTRLHADGSSWTVDRDGAMQSWHLSTGQDLLLSPDGDAASLYRDDTEVAMTRLDGSGWREQEDGSRLELGVGGSIVRIVASDGVTLATRQADGHYELAFADGTRSEFDADGVLLAWCSGDPALAEVRTEPDGSNVYQQVDGSSRVVGSDGSLLKLLSAGGADVLLGSSGATWSESGNTSVFDAQGRLMAYTPPERRVHIGDGGLSSWRQQDGAVRLLGTAGNLLTLYAPDGSQLTAQSDGTYTFLGTDGTVSTYGSDGRLSIHLERPVARAPLATSTTRLVHESDAWVVRASDGSAIRLYSSGAFQAVGTDGTSRETSTDERVLRYDANGNLTGWTDEDGSRMDVANDGSSIEMRADGTRAWSLGGCTVENTKDGRLVASLPNGGRLTRLTTGALTWAPSLSAGETGLASGYQAVLFASETLTVDVTADGAITVSQASGLAKTFYLGGATRSVSPTGITTLTALSGTVQVTWPDGNSRSTYSDGTVVIVTEDGTTTTTTPRGSVITQDAAGQLSVNIAPGSGDVMTSEGCVEGTDEQGAKVRWQPDGVRQQVSSDGAYVLSWLPDGTYRFDGPGGTSVVEDVYGNTTFISGDTRTMTRVDGTKVTWEADGTCVEVRPDGESTTRYADGVSTTISADGRRYVVVFGDGTSIERSAAGVITAALEEGSTLVTVESFGWSAQVEGLRTEWHTDGRIVRRLDDGTLSTLWSDGSTSTQSPDGGTVRRTSGGTVTANRADGSQTIWREDGTTTDLFANGDVVVSSPQGGNTVFSSTGSVTRTNADGTTTQTVGNSETTWLSGGMQRTLFKTEGLTLTSDADGAYSFSTDSGHQIFLGSDGLVQDEFQGTRRTLESVAVDLKGGGHLAVRGGMATVLLQDGNSLDVYSGGTRRETIGAVSTTYSPDGSMVQTEGAKTVWFNATDMSVTTAVAEKVVNRVDYDGVVTNFKYEYGQVHTEQKLTSGYTVIDGLCPQIQLRRIDGTVGPASVSVYRTPWGQADTEENKRMVALQAAGNGVVGMVNGHPLAGKVGVISSVGMHSSAVQVMTVKTADGQEMEVGNLLLLSATDKQDGRRQLRFYRYEPGLFQGDLKTSIDIVGRADKAELSKDPKYNDPVFSLNVTLVGGQQTTVKAAEFSPFEMTWTGTPAAGRAQFKQVPAIIATTPPEETSAAPPPTPPPLKPLDAIAGMKWEPSANSVRDAQEGNVLGILSYTIGMGGKVIHKLIESTVGWLADHLPAGFQQVAQFATGLLEGLSDSLIGMIGTTVDLVNFASQMTRLFVFSTPEQFVSDPYVCGVMKGVQDAVKRILEFTKAYNASLLRPKVRGRHRLTVDDRQKGTQSKWPARAARA